VSVNLQQIVTAPANTITFLFRNDNMFRSKQTVIRPSLHTLYNKVRCCANCIIPYFKVFVKFVFVLVGTTATGTSEQSLQLLTVTDSY